MTPTNELRFIKRAPHDLDPDEFIQVGSNQNNGPAGNFQPFKLQQKWVRDCVGEPANEWRDVELANEIP